MSKRGRRIPEILSEKEGKKLLNVFNTRYPSSLRNKAITRLMLKAGLRLDEVTSLKWNNINFRAGKLKVVEGKGAKDRQLYLGEKTLDLLNQWKEKQSKLLEKKDKNNTNNLVFTTSTSNRLDNANVRKMIYRYADKAGIQEEVTKHYRDQEGNKLTETYKEKKVTPHTLRHTFATEYYQLTKDIRKVQKALGHSDISTTMIYTHLIDEDLEEGMKTLDNKY